jgi:outer membrane protein
MRNMILLAALAASTAAIPAAAQAQRVPAKVAVIVDTDRIYQECTACRTASTQLSSQIQALQTRQTTLSNQLRPEREALQKAVQALNGRDPDAALTQRIQAFQQRERTAAQELQQSQQRIQSIQAHVLRQIDQRLSPVINQVMAARGANIALSVDATLAHSQTINVTNDVLARLNQALPSVSLTPLPQPAQQQQQQPQGR